ncbi:MAG: apolipoprotein N-acyltransferase [Actinobacteria bacterium]|nr:apolipoprotein N-acyltransferase [Actinomycetota bacterium]
MTGSRAYVVALASGVVLSFAYPEPSISPLAWISLVPLLLLLAATRSVARGARLGAAFGLGFFGTLLVWISIVGWVAWTVLVIVETAFAAAFGALCVLLSRRDRGTAGFRILVPPVAWVAVVEHLRSVVPVGGFTWGQLAQSQHDVAWILKAASIGGGWLVAFVIVLVNALIAEALLGRERDGKRAVVLIVLAAVAISAPAVLPRNHASGDEIRVALVQGNVPRDFTGSFYDKEFAITRSHRELTEGLAGEGIDLVVWPESAVGLDMSRDPDVAREVAAAAAAVDAPMIVGANLDIDRSRYRVVAFQVEPDGTIGDTYVKTHLVPFGEYVPMRSWLGWLPMLDQVPRDAVASDEAKLLDVAGAKVAPVLSYEGDFGALVRRRIDDGGRFLIVATNTSTWGRSWASAQHLAFSQVRAAETGVWVAHAAISGISGLVAPDAEVAESLPLWEEGTIVRDIRLAEDTTFYARSGEWLPLLCYIALIGLVATETQTRLRRWTSSPVGSDEPRSV